MDVLNMSADEKEQTFRLVSAVLHLGDIIFERDPKGQEDVSRQRAAAAAEGVAVTLSLCVAGRATVPRRVLR